MKFGDTEFVEDLTPGVLYIVATPIGNMRDISLRALGVLESVDVVAAEDTRRTGMLLKTYGLKKTLMSCYAHNEEKQSQRILELLKEGGTVALVSDAGTPGISDPGARLIRQVLSAGMRISVVPGPFAGITALAASGLDTDAFAFGGFIPRSGKQRKEWLDRFGGFAGTLLVYESPKRLLSTLRLLKESWGDRDCCIARELTKRYEEYIRGSLTEVIEDFAGREEVKGEIVVVLEGFREQKGKYADEEIKELCRGLLREGLGKKEASRKLAVMTGESVNACYALLLKCET